MKIKKIALVTFSLFALFTLTACEEELVDMDVANDTTTQMGDNVSQNDEQEMIETSIPHSVKTGDTEIKLNSVYSIPKNRKDNWYFTYQSQVNLELNLDSINPNFDVLVNNVYSDVSIIAHKARFNGLRQDSVNINYNDLPNGGINITKADNYVLPFQIEGINQNETTFTVWNGYGSSSVSYLSESKVREQAKAGKLNVVWTLLIKNKNTNEMVVKTITDKVSLPVKNEN